MCRFSFYALNLDEMEKVRKALYMFMDLFGLDRFEYETLARFFITVRKNYRQASPDEEQEGTCVGSRIDFLFDSGCLSQLDPRFPRRQQHLQHSQVIARHFQTAGGSS